MFEAIARIPLVYVVVACLTLGLAPFTPEPHLVEKVRMLFDGELTRPLDVFDLLLHGSPWVLLALVLVARAMAGGQS